MKYEIKAQADGESADIYINDFIGDWIDDYFGMGVTSKAFVGELASLPASIQTVRLHINSPGGDVVAASHISNIIRDQQAKGRIFEALIEGAAWSAATIITSACNPTRIADNALMMIHDPWSIALGNARDMRKEAEVLDKFRDTIVAAYQWKVALGEDELRALMEDETWMDADEAVEKGFADAKIEGARAAALFDSSHLAKLPKRLRAAEFIPEKFRERIQAMFLGAIHESPVQGSNVQGSTVGANNHSPVQGSTVQTFNGSTVGAIHESPVQPATPPAAVPPPAPSPVPSDDDRSTVQPFNSSTPDQTLNSPEGAVEPLNSGTDVLSIKQIVSLCNKAGVPEAAAEFLDKGLTVDQVKARLADADKIRARCAAAKMPERANKYIAAGMSANEVANELFDVLLARQGPEIDGHIGPEGERKSSAAKVIDYKKIFRNYTGKK